MVNQEPSDPKEPPIAKTNGQGVDFKPPLVANDSQQIGTEKNKSQVAPPPIGSPPPIPPVNTVTAPGNLYPQISIELIQNPSRFYAFPILGILIKTIILLPVFLYLGILGLGLSIGAIINSFIVLFIGRYWKTAYGFNIGWFRLLAKVNFFLFGLTNKYPGFSRQINDNFSLDLEYPEKSSRFFAVPFLGGSVRSLLLIPFLIYNYIVQYAVYIGVFLFSWLYVLIRGRYPESTFELTKDQTRLNLALYAYALGLSDKYPCFRISLHHKFKKLLLIGIAIILIILSNTYPYILNLISKDIPPIDDRDLQLETVSLQKENNSFYDFTEIQQQIYYPSEVSKDIENQLNSKQWNEKFVQDTLAKNEEAFVIFNQAETKEFQDPRYAEPKQILSNYTKMTGPSNIFNPLNALRISRLSSLKALSLSRQGKEEEALNEALKSVAIGQKIQDSQAGLLDYLVGITMKRVGFGAMQKIIAIAKLPPEILIQDAKYLEKFKNSKNGFQTAIKAEYLFISQVIDGVATGNAEMLKGITMEGADEETINSLQKIPTPRSNFYFQPNKTKALFADEFRSIINEGEKPCYQAEGQPIKMLSPFTTASSQAELVAKYIPFIMSGNAVGKILHDPLFSAFNTDEQIKKKCLDNLIVSATQLEFALRAYNLETGGYPATLDQLVPKYIPQVYEDPFDGKPIKYSPTKKILYSVGKDRVDSGGSEGDDWLTMPDPTFKIEF